MVPPDGCWDTGRVNDQKQDPRPPLPTSSARYGGLEGPAASDNGPELFPGEKALARTKAGSREEMRVLRRHYNWVNMVIALLACFALVAGALMLAPQPSGDITREVDHVAVAENAQGSAPFALAVPDLPEGWHANAASLRHEGTPSAETWYVSLVADDASNWMALRQVDAQDTPEAWAQTHLEDLAPTGESEVGEVTFERYSGTDDSQIALLGEVEGTLLLMSGSGDWAALEELTAGAVESVRATDQPAEQTEGTAEGTAQQS